jgi:putative alpha-1,2-mannosidase
MHLPSGKQFLIKAPAASLQNYYIASAKLNGRKYSKTYIPIKKILEGGVLEFNLASEPNKYWGTEPFTRPLSAIKD